MLRKRRKICTFGIVMAVALLMFALILGNTAMATTELVIWAWSDYEVLVFPLIQNVIDDFNVDHPDVKVVLQGFPGPQFNEKILPALSAGSGPQMFPVSAAGDNYIRAGVLEPLPEKYFPEAWIEETFPAMPRYFDYQKYLGAEEKYYAFSAGSMPYGVFYNRTMWAEAGLTNGDIPRTWDQLASVGEKLTLFDSKGNMIREGLAMKGVESFVLAALMNQLQGYQLSADGTQSLFDSTQVEEGMQFIYDLHYEYKIASTEFPVFIEAWTSGLAAMCWISTFLGGYTDTTAPDLDWGVFPGPLPTAGQMPELWAWTTLNHQLDLAVTTNTTPEQKEAGFALLRALVDDSDYLLALAQALSVVPARADLLTRPELQTPAFKAVAMMEPFGIPMGELVSDLIYVIQPQAVDKILLDGAPIRETLEATKKEGDRILAERSERLRLTEHSYVPPKDMSVINDWRSGKTPFPIE